MTPAERAVIDAARAFDAELSSNEGRYKEYFAAVKALQAAVRALPRPLSEQLAELRPGAVVEDDEGDSRTVIVSVPARSILIVEDGPDDWHWMGYREVTRVISNPEAARG